MKRREFLRSIVPFLGVAPVVPLIVGAPVEATGSGVTLSGNELLLGGRVALRMRPDGFLHVLPSAGDLGSGSLPIRTVMHGTDMVSVDLDAFHA